MQRQPHHAGTRGGTCAAMASLGVLGVGSKDAKHIKMHACKQEGRQTLLHTAIIATIRS